MKEVVNHSITGKQDIEGKAMAIYRHLNSSRFFDLDIAEKVIVYLFFRFLASDDSRKGILDEGLGFEVLTELAYRARWMEKIGEMDGDEVFSFILSIRDRLCSDRKEPDESLRSFCSSLGMELERSEFFDIFSYIWQRKITNYYSEDGVKLVEKVLKVSDGDFLFLESDTFPGPFIGIGSDRNLEAVISIRNDQDRVLGKMLLFMIIPEDKWKSHRVVKEFSEENLRTCSHEVPNKIVSFSATGIDARGGRNAADGFDRVMTIIAPMIEKGASAVLISNASFLSFGYGNARRCRKQLLDLDACLSVVFFGLGRSNMILLDKTRDDRANVLLSDLSGMDIRDVTEVASCLTDISDVPGELRDRVLTVSRAEVMENDFMLYPSFYMEQKIRETKRLDEIDARLKEKYSELKRLADLMS